MSTGLLDTTSAVQRFVPASGTPIPFIAVGIGKPMSVRISEVYTGNYKTGLFGGSKDMLITSAVKSIAAFDAKPRAINFLTKAVGKHTRLERPAATQQGTPYVFYSPALLDRSLTMDLTIVFDTFPKDVFDGIGSAFQEAAGIPIFLAQSVYLLAAGALIKLIGTAGEAFFDGKPSFDQSVPLDIELAGRPPLQPGFALITDKDVDTVDHTFRHTYHVNENGQVVDNSNRPYAEDVAYIVIAINGAEQKELASFAPTAASSAVIDRFFGAKPNQQILIDTLTDAIKLANDLKFRKKADELQTAIGNTTDTTRQAELQTQRDAYVTNILETLLKP